MIRATRNILSWLAAASLVTWCANGAKAQALPTAEGPGSFVSVGLRASDFQQDYGQRHIIGESFVFQVNPYRRFGIEGEGRLLNANTSESVKESTYLIGPKVYGLTHHIRPYVKVLGGRGTFDYPFHYAVGHYFVVAPGAGLDLRVGHRLTICVADFEYQVWPNFADGQLRPYGISSGISLELFQPGGLRGRHFSH
jgi:hypothetical protein